MNDSVENRLLIDLHVHTDLSNDGRSSIAKLAKAAVARGLDAIVLTDHDACVLDAPIRMGGVWLLPGCEISTTSGHVLGVLFDKKPDIAALRANGLPAASATVAMLRECGAVSVLAHPYEKKSAQPDVSTDCIECVNARVYIRNPDANMQAGVLAATFGLPAIGGSDAHCAGEVGNAYSVIGTSICTLPALREAILKGLCEPVLTKNTPRYKKGLSQFRKARRSHNLKRIIIGVIYTGYCILLDVIKPIPSQNHNH